MAEISQIIKDIESDDNTNAEHILHQLLEVAVSITGRGEISDDYTKTIEFPIGEDTIISDPYYQRVWIDTANDEEEIEDGDEIKAISKEIKSRLLKFDMQIKDTRKKVASEIFDKPLRKGV